MHVTYWDASQDSPRDCKQRHERVHFDSQPRLATLASRRHRRGSTCEYDSRTIAPRVLVCAIALTALRRGDQLLSRSPTISAATSTTTTTTTTTTSSGGATTTTTTLPATSLGPNGVTSTAIIAQNRLPGTTSWEIGGNVSSTVVQGFANLTYAKLGQTSISTLTRTRRPIA